MAISISQLKRMDTIEKVVIHSVDLSLYLVSILVDQKEHYITDAKGRLLRSHNILELQALFERLPVESMVLRQQSAYDEMVGQPLKTAANTMEVPLGNNRLGGAGPNDGQLH